MLFSTDVDLSWVLGLGAIAKLLSLSRSRLLEINTVINKAYLQVRLLSHSRLDRLSRLSVLNVEYISPVGWSLIAMKVFGIIMVGQECSQRAPPLIHIAIICSEASSPRMTDVR